MKYIYLISILLLVACEPTFDHIQTSRTDNQTNLLTIGNASNDIDAFNVTEIYVAANMSFFTILKVEELYLTNLTYNGKRVSWMYQNNERVDEFTMRIVLCIVTEDNITYCDYNKNETT